MPEGSSSAAPVTTPGPRAAKNLRTGCFALAMESPWKRAPAARKVYTPRVRDPRRMIPGIFGGSEMKRRRAGTLVVTCALFLFLTAAAPPSRKAAPGLTPDRVHFDLHGLAKK